MPLAKSPLEYDLELENLLRQAVNVAHLMGGGSPLEYIDNQSLEDFLELRKAVEWHQEQIKAELEKERNG